MILAEKPPVVELFRAKAPPMRCTVFSTIAAAVPVTTLFFFMAVRRSPAWRAALYAFAAALAVALAESCARYAASRGLV